MRNLEQSRSVVVGSWGSYYWIRYESAHVVAEAAVGSAVHSFKRAAVKSAIYWPVESAVYGRVCARVESLLFAGTGGGG